MKEKIFVVSGTTREEVKEIIRGAKVGANIRAGSAEGIAPTAPVETLSNGPFSGRLQSTFTQNANDRDGSATVKLYAFDSENSTQEKTATKLTDEELTVYCMKLGSSKTLASGKIVDILWFPSLNRYEIINLEC